MTEALLVLNPRAIPACIQAIRALDIPTCWISYMPEQQAADQINHAVATTQYDRYLIVADDTLPTQETLDLILNTADQGHPVVTGYCNLDENQHRDIVNLTTNELPPPPPQAASYQLMTRQQVDTHPDPVIPTTFAGLALTLLTRDILVAHPMRTTTHGGQIDYDLSYRLAQTGIPIVTPRGAYVHHVKERWNHMDRNPEKRLLIGLREPTVTWTNVKLPAFP